MADQLYLSLWFPNFRFEALPVALVSVLRQFALISGGPEGKQVSATSVYPISFTEPPTYQRIYVNDERAEDSEASIIENAVAEATEQLHDDMAYEFEMKWKLWTPQHDDDFHNRLDLGPDAESTAAFGRLDTTWKLQPATVRILGFGPRFDDASYGQNGHIRIDFGLDTPWIMDDTIEDSELDQLAQKHIQQNIEMLLAFTLSVEKHSGISSRLLWTESGEPLAEKLIARLQRLN
jgi:hypothetical protein